MKGKQISNQGRLDLSYPKNIDQYSQVSPQLCFFALPSVQKSPPRNTVKEYFTNKFSRDE